MRRFPIVVSAALVFAVAGTLSPAHAEALTTPQLVRAVSPSIVRVEIEGPVQETMTTGEGPNAKTEQVVRYKIFFGTGFVIDDAGHVVTNNHVLHPSGVKWEAEPQLTVEMPPNFDSHPSSFPDKATETAFHQLSQRNGRCYAPHPTVVGFDEAAFAQLLDPKK